MSVEKQGGCLNSILATRDPAIKAEELERVTCIGTAYLCPNDNCELFRSPNKYGDSYGECAVVKAAILAC